jgi:hypothetical protein
MMRGRAVGGMMRGSVVGGSNMPAGVQPRLGVSDPTALSDRGPLAHDAGGAARGGHGAAAAECSSAVPRPSQQTVLGSVPTSEAPLPSRSHQQGQGKLLRKAASKLCMKTIRGMVERAGVSPEGGVYDSADEVQQTYASEVVRQITGITEQFDDPWLAKLAPGDQQHTMTEADVVAWQAVREGHRSRLAAALDAGADRNFRGPLYDQGTLLHMACRAGHMGCATLLLRRGADRTLHAANGKSALQELLRPALSSPDQVAMLGRLAGMKKAYLDLADAADVAMPHHQLEPEPEPDRELELEPEPEREDHSARIVASQCNLARTAPRRRLYVHSHRLGEQILRLHDAKQRRQLCAQDALQRGCQLMEAKQWKEACGEFSRGKQELQAGQDEVWSQVNKDSGIDLHRVTSSLAGLGAHAVSPRESQPEQNKNDLDKLIEASIKADGRSCNWQLDEELMRKIIRHMLNEHTGTPPDACLSPRGTASDDVKVVFEAEKDGLVLTARRPDGSEPPPDKPCACV